MIAGSGKRNKVQLDITIAGGFYHPKAGNGDRPLEKPSFNFVLSAVASRLDELVKKVSVHNQLGIF